MQKKILSGNLGEWSEPYVVLKLAADGVLRQADDNLQPSQDDFARIVKVVREDLEVEIDDKGGATFSFYDQDKLRHNLYVPEGGMASKANRLFHTLKSMAKGKGAFEIPDFNEELEYLGFRELKNPVPEGKNFVKRDISLVIEDPHTGRAPSIGFSVKSELGSAPSLLNASRHTNLIYRIYGITDAQMNEINALDSKSVLYDRCALINKLASNVKFERYDSSVFMNNLRMVDGDLPTMISEVLLEHYISGKTLLKDVIAKVKETPRYADCDSVYCDVKIKRFLHASALGMMPSEPWKDVDEASGGYVIVLPDGNLVAFYIYNRQLFDDYLLDNTKFEHASSSRNQYGFVFKDEGKYFIKLNLQIRFTR